MLAGNSPYSQESLLDPDYWKTRKRHREHRGKNTTAKNK